MEEKVLEREADEERSLALEDLKSQDMVMN